MAITRKLSGGTHDGELVRVTICAPTVTLPKKTRLPSATYSQAAVCNTPIEVEVYERCLWWNEDGSCEERYVLRDNSCTYCGREGHRASHCPQRAAATA